ncbi:MAG: hypothetical protein REI12_02460 [Pedobacter sp.]|nr:hypothetical protein [Pedobacter sp.]
MAAIIMKKQSPLSIWASLIVVLAALLVSACGESTNLKDPKEIVSTTDCDELADADSDVTCVPGYFIDDVVENLNYSCDKVNSVTNVAGGFSCPAGSKVEFSILNPDDTSSTAKKIVLGSITVKRLAKASADAALYITPMDFGSQSAKNIVRLLQTLRDTNSVPDALPSRTIKLLDADKKKLTFLASSISAANFSISDDDDFEALFAPYLVAISKSPMIGVGRADFFLKKSIHSVAAGAYSVPGYTLTLGYRPTSGSSDGDVGGIRGISDTTFFLGATWNVVDRKGRITGFGVYTSGPKATDDKCKLLLPVDCTSVLERNILRQKNGSLNWTPWDTTSGKWQLSYDVLDSSSPGTVPGVFSFTQGEVDRGAVAGTPNVYAAIYGQTVTSDSNLLGRWKLIGTPDFSSPTDTSFTITRTRTVAPTLDPSFWDTTKITFPLKIRLNFLKADKASTIGSLRVLVLEDGNVVSNLQNKCGNGLNTETLQYSNGSKEFPLGTVAQIFSANNDSGGRRYIAPIILIPGDDQFADMQNIQIVVADGQVGSVRLRVDSGSSSAYLKMYADSAFDSAGNARDQDTSAEWANAVGLFKTTVPSGLQGYVTSQPDTAACN